MHKLRETDMVLTSVKPLEKSGGRDGRTGMILPGKKMAGKLGKIQ